MSWAAIELDQNDEATSVKPGKDDKMSRPTSFPPLMFELGLASSLQRSAVSVFSSQLSSGESEVVIFLVRSVRL